MLKVSKNPLRIHLLGQLSIKIDNASDLQSKIISFYSNTQGAQ